MSANGKIIELAVKDVVFREDLYPRIHTNPATVQTYAEDLSVLPAIEVNQRNELIDGWHRWTAHKKKQAPTIQARITETKSDSHLLELAIERNAAHGLQLSFEDKKKMAVRIFDGTPRAEQSAKKDLLRKILSVSERLLDDWLSRSIKDAKEQAKKDAFELWMSLHSQEAIAERVQWPRQTVTDWIKDFADFRTYAESGKTLANHADERFDPPLYNVWKFKEKSAGTKHFGNTEPTIVDNLLYLYTSPFDVVVDPFAGGGSTIDLCKKRFRRYWVSDRKIEPENEGRIRQWDITEGVPPLPRWEDVRLVYLDPPYWKQAENQYSKDKEDLANMPLEQFNKTLSGLIQSFAKKLKPHAAIALIIQPTQWNAPGREFTDHVADMIRMVKLPIDMRFSCPYESQQCNAQMVDWAKKNKKTLVLTRELVVWRVE